MKISAPTKEDAARLVAVRDAGLRSALILGGMLGGDRADAARMAVETARCGFGMSPLDRLLWTLEHGLTGAPARR